MNSLYSLQSQFLSLLPNDIALEIFSSVFYIVSFPFSVNFHQQTYYNFLHSEKKIFTCFLPLLTATLCLLIFQKIFLKLLCVLTVCNDRRYHPSPFILTSIHSGFYLPLKKTCSCQGHWFLPRFIFKLSSC